MINIDGVYWNRCYEPWRIDRDKQIKLELQEMGIEAKSFNASLLFEPPKIKKVMVPLIKYSPHSIEKDAWAKNRFQGSQKKALRLYSKEDLTLDCKLDDLKLLPKIQWYSTFEDEWAPGEKGASDRLDKFIENGICNYKVGRNRPDQEFVSRLSPHIHFGEISPHQIWHQINKINETEINGKSIDHFLSELGWREFSHNLLFTGRNYLKKIYRKNLINLLGVQMR